LLDENLQDMPFHAGEISIQVFTAMIISDFDFMKTLIFLTNYGRDNDTTAALAGAILGAYYGFERLPQKERQQVIKVSKEQLDLDLEQVARNFTASVYPE
ncbi:ADP-ribosylglycohydrolase family protein, partial [Aquiflexum sp.]|uniref:ADP-ribosylglycohydrolase family protein n=1 Tax=Aquiflexum sp. TaxID=1872584 RepID=UPI0035944BC1